MPCRGKSIVEQHIGRDSKKYSKDRIGKGMSREYSKC